MIRRLLCPLTLLLWTLLLTQTSCCTMLGYQIGASLDPEYPTQQSHAFRRAARRYAGKAILVTTREGRVVTGAYETVHDLTLPERRELYLTCADHAPGAPRLPLPGDTVLVSTGSRSGWMQFDRFLGRKPVPGAELLDTTDVAVRLRFLPGLAAEAVLPWASIDRMVWADSTRLDAPRNLLLNIARIPASPIIVTVLTESGANEVFRSWEVARIEMNPNGPRSNIGTFVGMGADGILVYLFCRSLSGLRFD